MNFCSDNVTGAAPEILEALQAANAGSAAAYGADAWTARLRDTVATLFECEVEIFPVVTGTAANSLALAALVPPFGAVFCHQASHIYVDECGGPEFQTGGAKLVDLPGDHGKLSAATLEPILGSWAEASVHQVQPAAISLTQATECGTVYRPEEMRAIGDLAHRHRLRLHVDGARFANALARLGASPADLSWRAGVDALSLGATKNGALGAELVVFFDPALARDFGFRRKRAGHLLSKMRFLSAQLEAYFADGLWLRNARHANRMADRLADGLARIPGVRIPNPVEANLFHVRMPETMIAGLEADGFRFYREGGPETIRLVTAFDTAPEAVDFFVEAARRLAGGAPELRAAAS